MADPALLTVKTLHVFAAMLWLGLGAYQSFLHVPSLKKIEARQRLAQMGAVFKKSGPIFGALAFLTVITGWELARQVLGTANPGDWFTASDPRGPLIGVGLLLALAALGTGIVHAPLSKKLAALAARPFTPAVSGEAERIYRRIAMLGHTGALFIVTAAFLMIASNLGGF